jgi:hypothetical protein
MAAQRPAANKKKPMTKAEQSAAFIEAARQLGCDEDPERFKEIVRKLAKAPPARRPSKAGKKRAS